MRKSADLGMMFPGETVTFRCTVDVSSGWDFLWYHNGNEIQARNSTYTIILIDHVNAGEYNCKAKRGKGPFYTEKSEATALQVSGKLDELCYCIKCLLPVYVPLRT